MVHNNNEKSYEKAILFCFVLFCLDSTTETENVALQVVCRKAYCKIYS